MGFDKMVSAKGTKSFNLLRWFSLMSFISIALISIVSAFLLSRFLHNNILKRDAAVTMQFVQAVFQTENTSAYFESDSHEKDKTIFENFFKRIRTIPEVVRVNIYSKDGTVIWSDDSRFIGHRFMPNPELIQALSGRLAIGSGTSGKPKKAEHVFDKDVPFFAEIYIPIMDNKRDAVVGAVEVYKVPLSLFGAIKKGNHLVWISAIIGGLFLYISLFWIVRRAAIIISNQQKIVIESEAMAALGEIASAVAHSIRNPLASIRSSAEVALDGEPTSSCRQTAQDIITQVDRVEKWVRDLLTSSQPLRSNTLPIPINGLIRENLGQFAKEMEKQGIKPNLDLKEHLPLLQADPALLTQMLNNLISNALEAMPNGGILTVASRSPEDRSRIDIEIIDTGQGIPKDQLENIFKPFFTMKQKGLGMGLYLTKRIVERHNGTIDFSSKEGQGTAIRISLPALR